MKGSSFNIPQRLLLTWRRMPRLGIYGSASLMFALFYLIPCEIAAQDEIDTEKEERSKRLVKRGRDLRKMGDLQGALQDLNEAVRADPYNSDAYVQRGITRSRTRDFDGSYFDFEKALELDPEDVTAIYGRGVMHQMKNDIDGALQDFNEVIRLRPRHNLALYRRGSLKFSTGEYEAAIEDFTTIIERKPNNPAAVSERGLCKMYLGDFEGALEDFDKALLINPRLYRTLFVRGKVHLLKGQSRAAIYDFDKALQINRQYPDVYLVRGLIHLIHGRDELALEDLDKTRNLYRKYEFEDYPQLWSWFVRTRQGLEKEANQQLRAHYEKRLEEEREGGAEISEWFSIQTRFQLGEINEETISAKAEEKLEDPDQESRLKCKLYYYGAMNSLLAKDPESAIPLLQKCLDTKRYGDIEYIAARLQLRLLGVKLEKVGHLNLPNLQASPIPEKWI